MVGWNENSSKKTSGSGVGVASGVGVGVGVAASSKAKSDEGIWAGILRDASSRSWNAANANVHQRRRLLVLGPPRSGKSTILAAVDHTGTQTQVMAPLETGGLALSYAYAHVEPDADVAYADKDKGDKGDRSDKGDRDKEDDDDMDDTEDDPVSLLELDDVRAFAPLLRVALPHAALAASAVVVCLPWSAPQDFLLVLDQHLATLTAHLASTAADAHLQQMRALAERQWRAYREPDALSAAPNASASASANAKDAFAFNSHTLDHNILAHAVSLPLGNGVLTHNLGVPIVVVCTKADLMPSLERDYGYGDGTFDYIQQSLRTVCLKYGASLFYTSIHRPKSIFYLRSYILHLLNRNSPHANQFPFPYRAEVIDRDNVRVPMGWDNWGLIRVQGSGFSCEAMAGWEDNSHGQAATTTTTTTTTSTSSSASPSSSLLFNSAPPLGPAPVSLANNNSSVVTGLALARALYETEIKTVKDKNKKTTPKQIVSAEDEQVFLERNLELLNSVINPGTPGGGIGGSVSPFAGASESFAKHLSHSHNASDGGVNSADMRDDLNAKLARLSKMKEQGSSTSAALRSKAGLFSDSAITSVPSSPSPASKPLAALNTAATASMAALGPAPIGGAGSSKAPTTTADNEALSNFFASLLNKKTATGSAVGGLGSRSSTLAGTAAAAAVAGGVGAGRTVPTPKSVSMALNPSSGPLSAVKSVSVPPLPPPAVVASATEESSSHV
ncbi:hypothetical protein HK100_002216 [Physocladia obscura]|uniref:Dynein light intermediate chain n=1 Tax=Physocladia obscura TaxID=109957 RepID=A0AAD5SYA5_9FUNG|nr:hypothetical protein HK100_002216 [Physocladia obscura]